MTFPIYLAGASRELERCEAMTALLRTIPSVEITVPWVEAIRARLTVGLTDADLTAQERRFEVVEGALRGVREAALVVALAPRGVHTSGLWAECALARELDTPVLMVASEEVQRAQLFCALGHIFVDTDEAVLPLVREIVDALGNVPREVEAHLNTVAAKLRDTHNTLDTLHAVELHQLTPQAKRSLRDASSALLKARMLIADLRANPQHLLRK